MSSHSVKTDPFFPDAIQVSTPAHSVERWIHHLRPIFIHRLGTLGIALGLAAPLAAIAGIAFRESVFYANQIRLAHPWILFFLPLAGLGIVWLYRRCGIAVRDEMGVLTRSMETAPEPAEVPSRLAPVVFFSTFLTHLFGGSAGCEGASLLIGGGVGAPIAQHFRLHHEEYRLLVLCAMASAFAPLLGTPLAAAFFVLERYSKSQLSFFVPCLLAAGGASMLSLALGGMPLRFAVQPVPLTVSTLAGISGLAVLCAGVAQLFRISLSQMDRIGKNPSRAAYVMIFVGALLVMSVMLGLGTSRYSGTGLSEIHAFLSGIVWGEDFFWKLVLTTLTLGVGFQGGRIVPAFFIGAAFGATVGSWFGLDAGTAASLGLITVFAGVVRCPITAGILSQELFLHTNPILFLWAIVVGEIVRHLFAPRGGSPWKIGLRR